VIEFRPMTVEDIPSVDPLLMASFGNANSYEPRLRRVLFLESEGWIVAEDEGRAIGCGGIVAMGGTAYVGLVAVDAAQRRRGIAKLVMERLLELARERGCSTLLLDASESGRPLYEKLGFVADDRVGVWQRPPAAPRAAPPTADDAPAHDDGIVLEPCSAADSALALRGDIRPELAAFDRATWGDDRRKVIASFVADDPELAMIARDSASGRIRGYAIVQAANGTIGPWVARDEIAASALLTWALGRFETDARTVYLPEANESGARLITGAGFALSRSNTHMRLGPALPAARRKYVYSQASFALG